MNIFLIPKRTSCNKMSRDKINEDVCYYVLMTDKSTDARPAQDVTTLKIKITDFPFIF